MWDSNFTRRGVWRGEYIVIDFYAFRETRVGLHIADHDNNEIYLPGIAHGDKEKPSFLVRDGATDRARLDIPDDMSWAEDIIAEMDASDGLIPGKNADPSTKVLAPDLPDEQIY